MEHQQIATQGSFRALVEPFGQVVDECEAVETSSDFVELPRHNLPYSRNTYFAGRELHMEFLTRTLHELSHEPQARPVVLFGLGAIGKTQIVLEYAYRQIEQTAKIVLWIDASSRISVTQCFTQIALDWKLQGGRNDPVQNQHLVLSLVSKSSQSFLLIFDNVDSVEDIDTFHEFLSIGPTVSVLMTTQNRRIEASWECFRIEVSMLPVDDGLALLLKMIGRPSYSHHEKQNARKLVLGVSPLLIVMNAGFMEKTGLSIGEFIKTFDELHLKRLEPVLAGLDFQPEPGSTYHTSLETHTTEVFDALNLLEARILGILSFLDPENIPRGLFHPLDTDKDLKGLEFVKDQDSIDEAFEKLAKLSLIRFDQYGYASIHRVIQSAFQHCMSPDKHRELLSQASQLLELAVSNIPNDSLVEQWKLCQKYMPHVLKLSLDL